jgi:hypothetical protein
LFLLKKISKKRTAFVHQILNVRPYVGLKGLDGSPGGKHQRRNRDAALWIDDPLQPGLNVGAGSFGMCHVQVITYFYCNDKSRLALK